MYCRFCGKELEENEICMCEQNNNKTVMSENPVPDKNKMKDNRKLMVIIALAAVLIGVAVFGVVRIVKAVEKKKAYEAIESQAMVELDKIMGNYYYDEELSEFETTKKPEREVTYTGVPLSDDIWDFTIAIDGIGYKLPTHFNNFKNSNWDYVYSMNNADNDEMGGESDTFVSQKNNNGEIMLCIINMSGNAKKVKDCNVGGLKYDLWKQENNCSIELAKELKLTSQSSVDDVISCWGEPTDRGTYYIEYEKSTGIKYHFDIEEETGTIRTFEMYNKIKSDGDNTVNGPAPDYSDRYIVPSGLNDNWKTFTVKLQGDYYTLPAPVSEFVRNGWVVTEAPVGIAAHQVSGITLTKGETYILCDIKNFEDYQISGTDAVVISLYISEYDESCDFEISGGIYRGMTETEFLSKINVSEFDVTVYTSKREYRDNDRSIDWHAYFYFNKEGKMDSVNIGKDFF